MQLEVFKQYASLKQQGYVVLRLDKMLLIVKKILQDKEQLLNQAGTSRTEVFEKVLRKDSVFRALQYQLLSLVEENGLEGNIEGIPTME